jgi:hypothetical protein
MDELHAFREKHKRDQQDTHQQKKQEIPQNKQPYINSSNELVIPFDSDPLYHYWNGGKSIFDILTGLGASEETLGEYTEKRRFS